MTSTPFARDPYHGTPRVGYIANSDSTEPPVVPDPATAPLVRDVFERAARTNLSVRQLMREMDSRGIRSRTGRRLREYTFHQILRDEFYYGAIWNGAAYVQGLHHPLIDRFLFEQVQRKLASRRCNKKELLYLSHEP